MHSGEFERSRSDLREAAETLEQALTEACAAPPAREADTGELIRVEEMLAIANDAARRAISIRRMARQGTEPGMEQSSHVPESSTSAGMDQPTSTAHRVFDDARGVKWDVWAVYPGGRPSQLSALRGPFQTGWLVFESSAEKRRLSPIPNDWSTMSAVELERLCQQASPASRRPRSRNPDQEDKTQPGD